jgi:hypothetical protein
MGATRSLTLLTDSMSPQAWPALHSLAQPGQGHVDYVAEGLLGEIGHPAANHVVIGIEAGPQVIFAVPQVSWEIGHGSSCWQMAGGPPGGQAGRAGNGRPGQGAGAGLAGRGRDVDGWQRADSGADRDGIGWGGWRIGAPLVAVAGRRFR